MSVRLLPALAAVSVLVLAGCSAADAATDAASDAPTSATQGDGGPQRSGPGGGGGASGEIASVTGTVLQVRSADSQTAVTWTDATEFSATVDGMLADVTVGSCVVAVSTATTDTDATDTTAPVEATSIRITRPTDDGTCAGGFGGGPALGGERPDGAPTDLPTMPEGERPDGAPTDLPPGGAVRSFSGGAIGTVSAVDGSTLTVETTGPDDETSTRTVTVTDATTYTTTVAADASAVVVGQCASARGEADDSGKVTATSITVSAPTDGECAGGMVQRFGDGGGPGGPGGPGGGQDSVPQEDTQDATQGGTDA
ncbi:hypothetical protein [Cellulomonas sp. Leaf334]|uniref:hypothetical protein n=1 Tax=Cellulomonas sp. Leaf334 TaxID=1736339 RepID=UPI000701DCAA|nr:hypothetical protein [Cellulomonas sp. Leaf334]KQR17088.1 hypothetical protein ASF78_07175 [Cellulomonas sp. Leaf334]